jgi:hypothetical protein
VGKRCWTIDFADEINFHIDVLPNVLEDEQTIRLLVVLGVNPELARHAIAITDRTYRTSAE